MPICLIQTNLSSVPDDFHIGFSKLIAETLNKPEEVYQYVFGYRHLYILRLIAKLNVWLFHLLSVSSVTL